MDVGDRLAAVIEREANVAGEALESLQTKFNVDLRLDAARMLHGWIRMHTYIGLALISMKFSGALRPSAMDKLMDGMQRASTDLMSDNLRLMYAHANVPMEKWDEVTRFIMLYLNRSITAVQDFVIKEFKQCEP